MNIGIDFDNTIVTYDEVFHRHAVRLGLISKEAAINKRDIRDTIRQLPDGKSKWIELQGMVYGLYISGAEFSPEIKRFLQTCKKESVRTFIISHKTVHPALGPQYNLRDAAKRWIEQSGLTTQFGFSMDDCFFVETKDEKLSKISECGCDYFIDDLIEVLANPDFPTSVKKILYATNPTGSLPETIVSFNSWDGIREFIFGE